MAPEIEKEYEIVQGPDKSGLERALFDRTVEIFKIKTRGSKRPFTVRCRVNMLRSKDGFKKWEIEGSANFSRRMANKKLSGKHFNFKAEYNSLDCDGWLTVTEVFGLGS